jgi:hypothetical protein
MAVSALPTMLLNYLTGPPTNEITTTSNNASDEHIDQTQITYKTESLPTTPTLLHATRQSSRYNPNRSSLPLMPNHDNIDFASREGSLVSSNGGKSKRPSSRPKTCYTIAHAPPKGNARHKIHVRARPLLQLHQLSQSKRPVPAFELLPSAIFSPSLSRAISKSFPTRHALCPADLAIVKAENYHQHEASPEQQEEESRNVLALICKGRKCDGNTASKAKLFLQDGSEWEAYSLPNGGYEFFSTDQHGLGVTARWVLKRPRTTRSQSASDMASPTWAPNDTTKKFTFSTISSTSRRHPIIASLSNTSLDINDSYTAPSPVPTSPGISPPASSHEHDQNSQEPVNTITDPIVTSQSLRTLITATAVWVTLREGWCPGYRYDDPMLPSPLLRPNNSPPKSPTELSSTSVTASQDDAPKRSGSIARILRSANPLKRTSTSSAPLDGTCSIDEPSIARSASGDLSSRRLRADSSSTVLIHASRPRGHRADTTSTTASGLAHMDFARNDMTEEEESIETTAAMLARSSKRASAPTPLIPSLHSDSEDEQGHSARSKPATKSPKAETKLAAGRQKCGSSTTSTNSIEAGKAAQVGLQPLKAKKRRRFRSLFCGLAG